MPLSRATATVEESCQLSFPTMSRSLRNPLLAVEIAPSNRRCSLSAVGAAAGVESASWRRSSSDVGAETGVDVGAETGVGEGALEQRPLRDGRQSVHDLPALTQEQDTQRPLPLHRQHTGIELPHPSLRKYSHA